MNIRGSDSGMDPDVVIDMICYTPESAVHLLKTRE